MEFSLKEGVMLGFMLTLTCFEQEFYEENMNTTLLNIIDKTMDNIWIRDKAWMKKDSIMCILTS